MGVGLREVAEQHAGVGIDLFREQTDVIREAGDVLECPLCLLAVAALRQVVDRPEAADAERAFQGGKPVEPGLVAQQQSVSCETWPGS